MPYKILTLDGGGAWALIEVMALIDMYGGAATGHEILRKFDLVAANSGGSIVLGGLVENLPLAKLLTYFNDETNRKAIFSPTSSWGNKILEALLHIAPKYSAAKKLPALQHLLPATGAKPVLGVTAGLAGPGGAPVRLMIVGFDYDHNRSTFFRSVLPPGPSLGVANPATMTMAEAIHSSTNAPINYFDAPATFKTRPQRYWDGGVSGFNNPVLAAVTEALAIGKPAQSIAALSLGTGMTSLKIGAQGAPASPYETPWQSSNLLNDLTKMASSILDDPPDSASFIAHVMTGGGTALPAGVVSRIIRLNPVICAVNNVAPGGMSANDFKFLCNINMDAIQPKEVDAITAYAKLWLAGTAPNQLLHSDGNDTANDLGQANYAAARAAWAALTDGEQAEIA